MTEATQITTTKQLGALVRTIRLEAGLDQATAAGLAGVGVRFFGDIERGKPSVRLGLVLQVLERLGLELRVARRGSDRGATRAPPATSVPPRAPATMASVATKPTPARTTLASVAAEPRQRWRAPRRKRT